MKNKQLQKEEYYMGLARLTASRSKDPHTKVGACIANDKRALSLGWNGAPRNIDDEIVPYGCNDKNKPLLQQKYPYIIHAEMNAILNYGGSLRDFENASIYVNVFPCIECSKFLIQAGIKEVIYEKEYSDSDIAKTLLRLGGVKFHKLNNPQE